MLAFETAEGVGAESTGGRGGVAYLVDLTIPDNVGSPTVGSPRHAFLASGPRHLIFKNGGTYDLLADIVVSDNRITISGQTSPADSGGVLFKGAAINFRTDNVIARFFRVRPGTTSGLGGNPILIGGGGVHAHDIILDHLEASWGYDQMGPEAAGWWSNITVQWCASGEGTLSNHNLGANVEMVPWNAAGTIGTVSYHHNWFHNVSGRTPLMASGLSNGSQHGNPCLLADIRNILVHNVPNNHLDLRTRIFSQGSVTTWEANTSAPRHAVRANVIGCVLNQGGGPGNQTGGGSKSLLLVNAHCQVYALDNRQFNNLPGVAPAFNGLGDIAKIQRYSGNVGVDGTSTTVDLPGEWDPVSEGVETATPFVLARSVVATESHLLKALMMVNGGCILPAPDSVLLRWRAEVAAGTGSWGIQHSDYATLAAGTPPLRSQPDQIEDEFKDLFGFSNSVDYTGVIDPSGYDIIELYEHWRAGESAPSTPPAVINVFPVNEQLGNAVETFVAGFDVVNSAGLTKTRLRVSDGASITTIDNSGGGNIG